VTVENPAELGAAFELAKASTRSQVIVMKVDPYDGWTARGHAWWEVGTPEVTTNDRVRAAHEDQEQGRARQRRGV
jgi:3D-(3,5/4)-trihydroxycyclohexane-1,2-dione acylhydrolase (decyclizing)